MEPKWLEWAKRLQSISQAGLTYSQNPYDIERYEMLREIYTEIMAHKTESDMATINNLFANEKGYLTPKVDVRGVVFKDGKILMVREKIDGRWSIPGGWADVGFSPAEIAVKEIWEESGYNARAVRLLAVFDKLHHKHPISPYHTYKIFILCEITGGEAGGGLETSEVGFFGLDELPILSIERITKEQIEAMFEMYNNDAKEAKFD